MAHLIPDRNMALVVDDISEAVHWYRDRFVCSILHEDHSWAVLRLGDVQLALVLPEQDPAHSGFVTKPVSDSIPFLTPSGNGVHFPYVEESAEFEEAA